MASSMGIRPTEISPLAPLGTCSTVATASQNKIVSTIRNMEVVADNTNVLALEGAVRRKKLLKGSPKNSTIISLCNAHRLVRTQPLIDPRHMPHFKIFSIVTAGRDTGSQTFELESLQKHLLFYLAFFTQNETPYLFKNIEVQITLLENEKIKGLITSNVFQPLRKIFPTVEFNFDPDRKGGRGYYQKCCFKINAENKKGIPFSLTDGGFTDWTQQFLNNKKERLLISGFGTELICLFFGKV